MKKVVFQTGDMDGFFARAKDTARRADQGQDFDDRVTNSFEDQQRMFKVLSEGHYRLMSEVVHEPKPNLRKQGTNA